MPRMFVQGNDTPSFSQHLVIHEGLTNFLLDLLRVKLSILRGSVIKAIFFTVRKFELKLHTEREKRLEEGELLLLLCGSGALSILLSRTLFLDGLQCIRSNV